MTGTSTTAPQNPQLLVALETLQLESGEELPSRQHGCSPTLAPASCRASFRPRVSRWHRAAQLADRFLSPAGSWSTVQMNYGCSMPVSALVIHCCSTTPTSVFLLHSYDCLVPAPCPLVIVTALRARMQEGCRLAQLSAAVLCSVQGQGAFSLLPRAPFVNPYGNRSQDYITKT